MKYNIGDVVTLYDKIDDEAMNKLNRIIGERKDLRNFLNEKLEGFEELEYKLNKTHPYSRHFCDKIPHKGEILDVIEDFSQFSRANKELLMILIKLLFPALDIPANNRLIEKSDISMFSKILFAKNLHVSFPLSL